MKPSSRLRVLVADRLCAIGQSLAHSISAPDIEVHGSVATLEDARAVLAKAEIDLLVVSLISTPPFDELAALQRDFPALKIVLLDQQTVDAHIHQTLRLNLTGYLTKNQPLAQIIGALRRAAQGERVFAPDVAARLVFSFEGVRLGGAARPSLLAQLTPRELDVLIYIARGYTVKQCASALGISPSTVDNHKSRLMSKLKVHKAVELTHIAVREGLLSATGSSTDGPDAAVHQTSV